MRAALLYTLPFLSPHQCKRRLLLQQRRSWPITHCLCLSATPPSAAGIGRTTELEQKLFFFFVFFFLFKTGIPSDKS